MCKDYFQAPVAALAAWKERVVGLSLVPRRDPCAFGA